MRAITCEQFGTPDILSLVDLPAPTPGPGQVRIAVYAASANYPDGLMVADLYQGTPALPFTPGQEAAGVIDALGEGVVGLSVGERVIGLSSSRGGGGAFAEYMLSDAKAVIAIGEHLPFAEAAAFSVTYGTTLYALRDRAQLQPGETLLVLGAGGGSGSAAVELGKLLGAHVIAAASTNEKLDVARKMGAAQLVNYGSGDLRQQLRDICGDRGVDVIYDPVGGHLAEQAFRSIAWKGRYLVIGFAGGSIPAIPLNLPLLKGASVVGVFWGASMEREPDRLRVETADLQRWLSEGKLQPHIGQRYPLERAPEALKDLLAGRAEGKLIIEVR